MATLKDTSKEQAELQKQIEQARKDAEFFGGLQKAKESQDIFTGTNEINTTITREQADQRAGSSESGRALYSKLRAGLDVGGGFERFKGYSFDNPIQHVRAFESQASQLEEQLQALQAPQASEVAFKEAQDASQAEFNKELDRLNNRNNQLSAKGFASTTETNEILRNKQLIADLEQQKKSALEAVGTFEDFEFDPNKKQEIQRATPSFEGRYQKTINSIKADIAARESNPNITNEDRKSIARSKKELLNLESAARQRSEAQVKRNALMDRVNELPEGSSQRVSAEKAFKEFEMKQAEIEQARFDLQESKNIAINELERDAQRRRSMDTRARLTRLGGSVTARKELEKLATEEVDKDVSDDVADRMEEIEEQFESKVKELDKNQSSLDFDIENFDTNFDTEDMREQLKAEQEQQGIEDIMNEYAQKGEEVSVQFAENVWKSRQKYTEAKPPTVAEQSLELDTIFAQPSFDKSTGFETAYAKFGDKNEAEDYLSSRLFPEREIQQQLEAYQMDVLGYTPEQVMEEKKEKSVKKRMLLAMEGNLSEEERDTLEKELLLSEGKTGFKYRALLEDPDRDPLDIERAWKRETFVSNARKKSSAKKDDDKEDEKEETKKTEGDGSFSSFLEPEGEFVDGKFQQKETKEEQKDEEELSEEELDALLLG